MSRTYLAVLAGVAVLILAVGLTVRRALEPADQPALAAPPSEAAPLQQLSQEGALRRIADFVAQRVAAAAPLVEYEPASRASAVRWHADTLVSTTSARAIVAVAAPPRDSTPRVVEPSQDSTAQGWVIAVGRRNDGRVVSAWGMLGGRGRARCGEDDVDELVLGIVLPERFAGAGLFALDGRLVGLVARCGDRLAAIAVADVARLLANPAAAASRRIRDRFGLEAAALDTLARAYFDSDSGLVVTMVHPNGPAAAAGLQPGDVLLAIGGRPIGGALDLATLAAAGTLPDTLAVRRLRGRAIATVRLALRTDSAGIRGAAAEGVGGALGIDVAPPVPPSGILITSVRPGSPANAAGLRPGDRLLRIDRTPVRTSADVARLLGATATAPTFLVYRRDSVERGVLVSPAASR